MYISTTVSQKINTHMQSVLERPFYCRPSIFCIFSTGREKLRPQQHCPSKWSGTNAEVSPYGRRDMWETVANVHFKRCQNGPEKPICHNNSWPCSEHHPIDSRFPWHLVCVNKAAKPYNQIMWIWGGEASLILFPNDPPCSGSLTTIWFPRKIIMDVNTFREAGRR